MSQNEVIKKIDHEEKANLERQHKRGRERSERTVNRTFNICRI